MAFVQSFTLEQSADGLTALFTDNSNYDSEGILRSAVVRTVTAKDANGDDIDEASYVLPDDEDTLTIPLSKDFYAVIKETISGDVTAEKEVEYALSRQFVQKYKAAMRKGCCKSLPDMCDVDDYRAAFTDAGISGDGVAFQNYIDAGVALLDALPW